MNATTDTNVTADTDEIESTRLELRRLLDPEPRMRELNMSAEFPRSQTMRTVLDPRYRWLWIAAASVAGVMVLRRVPVQKLAPLLTAGLALRQRLAHPGVYGHGHPGAAYGPFGPYPDPYR